MGYWLAKTFWRQGIMTEAANKVMEFAFNDLNLNRVNISAVIENEASNATIRKLGFVFEGVKKQALRSKATNKLHDLNTYGLLREDWEKARHKK